MILVDDALRRRAAEGRPIRVGLIGAGFMARGVAWQLRRALPGFHLAAVANRTPSRAEDVVRGVGIEALERVDDPGALEGGIEAGRTCITDDPRLLTASSSIDVVIESTGAVEFGARVLSNAIEDGCDVVSMNAEVDATVGPILQDMAVRAGVIVTGADGDQPAVQRNLVRFVESLGLTPRVCGNVKGLQDRYRTPETQRRFAEQWGQSATMVTSFADGTKISMEQALVANAVGFGVAQSGMLGPTFDGHVDALTSYYLEHVGLDRLRELGGIVDYVVGASPSPGVFVFAENEHPHQEVYLRYGKLGDGPLYSFYVPYHLTALEVHLSVARVALFRDHVVTSRVAAPSVDVVTRAKRPLAAGERLDGLGGFDTYGTCEGAAVAFDHRMLPIGIAEGARLTRDLPRDAHVTYDDVELVEGSTAVQLRRRQDERFWGAQ